MKNASCSEDQNTSQLRLGFKSYKDLISSVRDLKHKGGPYARAAQQVQALIGRISSGEPAPLDGLRLTKHGETRIPKCVKYDLAGRARLVTIQNAGLCILCFAGTHEDAERWIERHRGLRLVVDKTGDVSIIETIRTSGLHEPPGQRISGESDLSMGPLFDRLPEELFDLLTTGLPRSVVRALENIEATSEEEEILTAATLVTASEQADAIFDVFILLRQGEVESAIQRIRHYAGELVDIETVEESIIDEGVDGKSLATIPTDSPQYKKLFEHFMRTADYRDWMLYMHPDQEAVAQKDYSGSAKLSGVSGSGKTCIVVKRSIYLAERYPEERILILTLNRPLAKLISELVASCAPSEVVARIDVQPFFRVCQRMLRDFEPGSEKLYDEVTWKSSEHIDEIWREFYRCELSWRGAQHLLPVHDSLLCRGVEAETYIRQEFDWIRSALAQENRRQYLSIQRKGRSHPLDQYLRSCLLKGLKAWEEKMTLIGVTDYLGIATALYKYIDKISPQYRCVLVDESQDFGTLELQLIRSLTAEGENDLFLAGDAAQHVSVKHQSLIQAGIRVPPVHSMTIRKNYRNTRAILQVANQIVVNHLSDEMLEKEDFQILDPEYADLQGTPVICLKAEDVGSEIASAIAYCKDALSASRTAKACIAICGWSLYEIQRFGARVELPVLDGSVSIEYGSIFLSDLEQTKGFEFDTVVIVNLNDAVVPNATLPEQEQFRDLSRLFVAMTRAKTELVLSWSSKRSVFMDGLGGLLLEDDWHEYVAVEDMKPVGVPPILDELRSENVPVCELANMTGEQFLYTQDAIGLSSELIKKIRTLISGKNRYLQRSPVEWSTMGGAMEDTLRYPAARRVFGPVVVKQFHSLGQKLGLVGRKVPVSKTESSTALHKISAPIKGKSTVRMGPKKRREENARRTAGVFGEDPEEKLTKVRGLVSPQEIAKLRNASKRGKREGIERARTVSYRPFRGGSVDSNRRKH